MLKISPLHQSDVARGGRSVCRLDPTGPTENQTTVPDGSNKSKKRLKESASQSARTSKAGYDDSGIRGKEG